MNIIDILNEQTNLEFDALRRSNLRNDIYSEAFRRLLNLRNRLSTYFVAHPEDACGVFGPELELPTLRFNDILDKCSKALRDNDDARFSLYDLADAIGHAPFSLNIDKLLALSDKDFYKVVTAMADAKRRTYCSDFGDCSDAYMTADDLDALVRLHGLENASDN